MTSAQPDRQQAAPAGRTDAQRGNTFRAALVGLALVFALAWVIPNWMLWLHGRLESGGHLPLIPVALVLVLLGISRLPGVRGRLLKRDIRVIFGILMVGTVGFSSIGNIIALLPLPYYFATPENDYEGHFLSEVPTHLVPYQDPGDGSMPDAIVWFYRGLPPGESVPWAAWAGPVGWWLALLVLLFGAQICLGALLRKQWEEHEKLMFPHVSMVTGLLEDGTPERPSIWRDRLFYAGLSISALLMILDGLNHYFPALPSPRLDDITMRPFLSEEPWKSMRPDLKIHPYLVAISYLLTTEISLSIWLLAVIDNFMHAAASAFGLPQAVTNAWLSGGLNGGADAVGAVIVFVGALLWTARRHFKTAFLAAIGKGEPGSDSEEGLSYPAAVWGFWLCGVGVVAWCVMADMSLLYAMVVFGLYSVAVVFLARLVSETGLISGRAPYRPTRESIKWLGFGGGDLTERALGQASANPRVVRTMSLMSFIYPSVLILEGALTPLLTGMRAVTSDSGMSRGNGRARRCVLLVGSLGMVLATAVFAGRLLQGTYSRGALHSSLDWFHQGTWIFENELVRDMVLREAAQQPDWTQIGFVFVGAGIMAILLYLRRAFYWWPIHPIGYIASGINRGLWFSVLIGWFIKRSILKYGGGDGFKRSIPFFVGLFIGQYALSAVWYIVGLFVGELQPPFHALR